jgi:hypothetical protein
MKNKITAEQVRKLNNLLMDEWGDFEEMDDSIRHTINSKITIEIGNDGSLFVLDFDNCEEMSERELYLLMLMVNIDIYETI